MHIHASAPDGHPHFPGLPSGLRGLSLCTRDPSKSPRPRGPHCAFRSSDCLARQPRAPESSGGLHVPRSPHPPKLIATSPWHRLSSHPFLLRTARCLAQGVFLVCCSSPEPPHPHIAGEPLFLPPSLNRGCIPWPRGLAHDFTTPCLAVLLREMGTRGPASGVAAWRGLIMEALRKVPRTGGPSG